MSRGRKYEIPASVALSPVRMKAAQNLAEEEATRRSQARESESASVRWAIEGGDHDLRRRPYVGRQARKEGLTGGTCLTVGAGPHVRNLSPIP